MLGAVQESPLTTTADGRGGSAPLLPDYGGACISEVSPALMRVVGQDPARQRSASPPDIPAVPSWLPEPARQARQIVLLILDGLGWEQLGGHAGSAPTLASMSGGPITSVAPSTTSTALTSIATGVPPSLHGVLGYRVLVPTGEVMNVLRWTTASGDVRDSVVPEQFQRIPSFGGHAVPVVSRSYFATSGFTRAYLQGATHVGWRVASSLAVEVSRLLEERASLVVAYYDGIDVVAHERGLGHHYDAELVAADRIVADLLAALPDGAALVVTADHGQVEVRPEPVDFEEAILERVTTMSGEGRFRWLHVDGGREAAATVASMAAESLGGTAWVRTRDQVVEEGWFGGPLSDELAGRVGDVAVAARDAVWFRDPAEKDAQLVCRHGSLTRAEMLVPLLAARR
jgi:predicted AlkP superfamily pyrophosphatase or phosphodiesterase